MIVKLTWHGEPVGRLDVQFVWPPPLDRGALLPLLSAESGSAAISVVFQFSGALDALELDLAKPIVLFGPLGGPSEVGAFQGSVEARFDEVDVHGFVAGLLGNRGRKGPHLVIQREVGESGFALSGSELSGHLEIAGQGGPLTFGATVEGSRSQLRAYPNGGGVIELRSVDHTALISSLNWRWPRSFDPERPWTVALRALLEFIAKHQRSTLVLGFELAPEEAFQSPSLLASSPPPLRDEALVRGLPRSVARPPSLAAPRRASRVVLLGGVAVALAAVLAAALLWKPSVGGKDPTLLPGGTVSTGALRPMPPGAAGR